ncbi:hypothetical protein FYK55_07140 [Roseiconus nitratireducens]|uniref:SLA1 homology domain-containing protein n=1 Tax=Roseiconus nitratireducens TaxID=2605748 RepID=A0A5M6DD24_9BACT|nr:SHD1 domain-containing protein [Roseiconus nitratireducens]KAA5545418.1 hypothetical protein FYK55_07140 [Roseiconus nitratireducens]
MRRRINPGMMGVIPLSWVLSACLGSIAPAAETWTDSSGKFQIEADYAGVQGKSVVLRKSDGSTISVPIDRLSDQSRALAKRLYEQSKQPQGIASPTTSGAIDVSSYDPPSQFANLVAPAPPQIPPLAPFPSDPTLQEQLDYVKQQVLAGHLEVIWHCLPEDLRAQLDSQEMRDIFRDYLNDYSQQSRTFEDTMAKLVEVLTTKKEFVLGSSMLSNQPPQVVPMIRKAYDPAVGTLYELLSLSAALGNLDEKPISQITHYHLPRLGAHLKQLVAMAPPEKVNQFVDSIVVEQSGPNAGTLTAPAENGKMESIEMVKDSGRWLPKDFLDLWNENKATFLEQARESAESSQQELAEKTPPQVAAMLETVGQAANQSLDAMLAAKSQQQFDQVLMQTFQQAMMMGAAFGAGPGMPAGGGPGGPGGGPGGPAGPGFGDEPF